MKARATMPAPHERIDQGRLWMRSRTSTVLIQLGFCTFKATQNRNQNWVSHGSFHKPSPHNGPRLESYSGYPRDETMRFVVAPTIIYGDESFVTAAQEKMG